MIYINNSRLPLDNKMSQWSTMVLRYSANRTWNIPCRWPAPTQPFSLDEKCVGSMFISSSPFWYAMRADNWQKVFHRWLWHSALLHFPSANVLRWSVDLNRVLINTIRPRFVGRSCASSQQSGLVSSERRHKQVAKTEKLQTLFCHQKSIVILVHVWMRFGPQ